MMIPFCHKHQFESPSLTKVALLGRVGWLLPFSLSKPKPATSKKEGAVAGLVQLGTVLRGSSWIAQDTLGGVRCRAANDLRTRVRTVKEARPGPSLTVPIPPSCIMGGSLV